MKLLNPHFITLAQRPSGGLYPQPEPLWLLLLTSRDVKPPHRPSSKSLSRVTAAVPQPPDGSSPVYITSFPLLSFNTAAGPQNPAPPRRPPPCQSLVVLHPLPLLHLQPISTTFKKKHPMFMCVLVEMVVGLGESEELYIKS